MAKSKIKQVVSFDSLSTADRTEVVNMIKEVSNASFQIESLNEQKKAYSSRAKEEFGIDPAEFKQMVSLYHQGKRDEYEQKKDSVLEKYDVLFPRD